MHNKGAAGHQHASDVLSIVGHALKLPMFPPGQAYAMLDHLGVVRRFTPGRQPLNHYQWRTFVTFVGSVFPAVFALLCLQRPLAAIARPDYNPVHIYITVIVGEHWTERLAKIQGGVCSNRVGQASLQLAAIVLAMRQHSCASCRLCRQAQLTVACCNSSNPTTLNFLAFASLQARFCMTPGSTSFTRHSTATRRAQ
jgi:hypothetical protein